MQRHAFDDWSPLLGIRSPFARTGDSAYSVPTPSDYDGTNDYQTRGADLTGNAAGKAGTALFFVRLDALSRVIFARLNNHVLIDTPSGRFRFFGRNAAGTTILTMESNTVFGTGASWISVLASWDLANTTGHLYINDASDLKAGPTLTDDTINYAGAPDWGFGGHSNGNQLFDGCLSVAWIDFGTYYDLSVEANRRKFVSADNKPVNLGSDGSAPGSAPIIFTDNGDLTNNKGTGGDFTTTGALAACSSNPSD